MTTTVVRYQAKPERADENQQLIEAVFADLEARQPDGFTYKVFRLDDGVSFIHVVIEHDDVDHPDSLTQGSHPSRSDLVANPPKRVVVTSTARDGGSTCDRCEPEVPARRSSVSPSS